GITETAKFLGAQSLQGGSKVIASYSIAAPGGDWDASDGGQYVFALQANEVADAAGNMATASTLGHFAAEFARTLVVTTAADDGPGSLRQTIADANTTRAADTITFDPSVFASSQIIPLASGQLAITQSLSIVGPGFDKLTIHGLNKSRVF